MRMLTLMMGIKKIEKIRIEETRSRAGVTPLVRTSGKRDCDGYDMRRERRRNMQ